jgi:hypothetical protein
VKCGGSFAQCSVYLVPVFGAHLESRGLPCYAIVEAITKTTLFKRLTVDTYSFCLLFDQPSGSLDESSFQPVEWNCYKSLYECKYTVPKERIDKNLTFYIT